MTSQKVSENVVIYPEAFGKNIGKPFYSELKQVFSTVRYYKNIPEKYLNCLNDGITKLTGIKFDSCVINGYPKFKHQGRATATVLFLNHVLRFKRNQDKKIIKKNCPMGTLIVFGNKFDENWECILPRHLVVTFFNANVFPLQDIYLNKEKRETFLEVIRDKLSVIRSQPLGKQCIEKYAKFNKLLGKGDYGNVYLSSINDLQFAIKLAKLKEGSISNPYSRFDTSWSEVLIMRNIFQPIIKNNICPNLPLLIDSFVCDNCKLTIRDKTERMPCIITITELASGTFRDFLKNENPTEKELYSALFQIMAALHAIQLHGQIMNYDVKADNILYYDVTPGGYWEYIIHGKSFFVPNFGKLFVLNDFGISRPMSPDFQLYREPDELTFRLGSRFAIIIDGKFTPLVSALEPSHKGKLQKAALVKWVGDNLKSSRGAQYRLLKKSQEIIDTSVHLTKTQIKFLEKHNLPTNSLQKQFFLHPEVIPPFEFYNDLQDAIRTFIGGKRTTQRGDHKRYPVVTDALYEKLSKYNGVGENLSAQKFSTDPSQVLAGYFIESFFVREWDYTQRKEEGKLLGKYKMS
jgi:serine/threonine protein kinase